MSELVFLKLGGSLITDKTRPYTLRAERLADLAGQIAAARADSPGLRLLLGHGSGSFGHTAAKEFGTREGPPPPAPSPVPEGKGGRGAGAYWQGFAEVGYQAARLNRLVMDALRAAGCPAISLPPSAAVTARDGAAARWDLGPLERALDAGLLPVIYGDVVFDEARGGTILSTEELFAYLAPRLRPARILVAGLEEGVWADFPARTRLVEALDPASFGAVRPGVGPAAGADVTGGMAEKARLLLDLCAREPGLRARIFSGETPDAVRRALRGEPLGTLIRGE